MCRSSIAGEPPKRCPGEKDPVARNKRNAARRQQYAHRKFILPLSIVRESIETTDITQKFHTKWTDEEKQEVRAYTSKNFKDIRQHFNDYFDHETGKEIGWISPLTVAHNERVIQALDSALAKAVPPEHPRVLYRGFTIPRHITDTNQWVDDNYKEGAVVEDPSYVSTTVDPAQAVTEFGSRGVAHRHIVFEFITKEGAYISDTSRWANEREVLIPRNIKFKVHAVHKKADYQVETKDYGLLVSQNTTVIQLVDVAA